MISSDDAWVGMSLRIEALFAPPGALPRLQPWWGQIKNCPSHEASARARLMREFGDWLFPDKNPSIAPWEKSPEYERAYSCVSAVLTAFLARNDAILPALLSRAERLCKGLDWPTPVVS